MGTKKRCTFMIDAELLDRLRSVKRRTGLSESEQIRQGVRWWLESREWPLKTATLDTPGASEPPARVTGTPVRRRKRGS